ncbi:adhesion G protein-coupled receptor E3-like [Antedon mediterranea]|uniref:adhesion G protein-coupled receptor E3-like n=1 Tax=Antedon mediterranea TaxID=105859 RepID=UPI003AF98875
MDGLNCPEGMIYNIRFSSCYGKSTSSVTYQEGGTVCQAVYGGYLAIISCQEENDWILNNIFDFPLENAWIGYEDIEGAFVWSTKFITNEETTYQYPNTEEPDVEETHCIAITSSGKWNKINCEYEAIAVCEKHYNQSTHCPSANTEITTEITFSGNTDDTEVDLYSMATTVSNEGIFQVVDKIKEFEDDILAQIYEMESNEEVYYESNFVGLAKVQSINESDTVNTSVELGDSRVEFGLQLQPNQASTFTGDVLVIASYTAYSNRISDVVSERVEQTKTDKNVEFRYLTKNIFSCSIYDMATLKYLNATLRYSFFENLVEHNETKIQKKVPVCLFFDEMKMAWSDEGVGTGHHSKNEISCYSEHLTSFCVLMKVTTDEVQEDAVVDDNKTLSVMSTVCVSVSLVGLIVSLVVYCSFSKLWKLLRNSIHKNLVLNMILMQTLFIFGINKTENQMFCRFISIVLHLTSLNTIAWMCGEAVYLFFMVSTSSYTKYNRLRYYLFFCYGVPITVVAVSSAGFASVYDVQHICWLSQETGMIWTFVAPAICIVTINTGIMCIVLKTIYDRSGNMVGKGTGEKKKLTQLRKATRGTFMLLPLMGTAWLIGPFAVGSDAAFIEYVFNMLNGCQGIFIFLMYCVFDNEVKECFQKRFLNNQVTTGTSQTAEMTIRNENKA